MAGQDIFHTLRDNDDIGIAQQQCPSDVGSNLGAAHCTFQVITVKAADT